jgi:flagellar motor switch protein FliN/FliY
MAEGIEIEFTDNEAEVSPPFGGWDSVEGPKPPKEESATAGEAVAAEEAVATATEEAPAEPPAAPAAPATPPPVIERTAEEGVVQSAMFSSLEPGAAAAANNNLGLLMDVTVPIAVELGRSTMKIEEILGLSSGAVIELDKLVDEPVDLKVNGKLMARGEIVVVDDFFGIRVSEIVDKQVGAKA